MHPRRSILMFLLIWLASACVAQANDHIVARGVLEDASGTMTIEQAAEAHFAPAGTIFSAGYTQAVHWLRITVAPRADGGPLVLRIRPTFLDEVRLYRRDAHGHWQVSTTGDRTPFPQRESPTVTLGFIVHPTAAATDYYLRLKTTSSSILSVQGLTPHEAQLQETALELLQTLFIGFMLWLLFWAINDYVSNREAVVAWFALNQCVYLFYVIAISGRLAPLLPSTPAGAVDVLTTLAVCLATLFGLIKHRVVLALFNPSRIVLRVLDAMIVLTVLVLLLAALGHALWAVRINAWILLATSPTVIVLAFTARRNRPVLRLIYGVLAASLLVSILPLVGSANAVQWTLNAWMFHGFVSAGLMFMLLSHRSRRLRRKRARQTVRLELARRQLDSERLQRELQNRFMSMLNHELKTPLSAIRMALGMKTLTPTSRQHAQQAVADIDAVIQRTLQADQLEQGRMALKREACDLNHLVRALCASGPAAGRMQFDVSALPEVHTDPQLLQVVMSNLIDNADKYGDRDGQIRLTVAPSPWQSTAGVLLSVGNAPGVGGIPDPVQIFEKYYRGAASHGTSGSGLGLYLVRGLAEQLGGWARCVPSESEVRFDIWIPC